MSVILTRRAGVQSRPFLLLAMLLTALISVGGCRSQRQQASKPVPAPAFAARSRAPITPPRAIDDILALPDAEFDLDEAVLALGREINPEADSTEALVSLNALSEAAREELPLDPDPLDYIDALYTAVMNRKAAEPFREDRAEDYDLAYTIKKRRGTCLSAGILVLAVSRRIGAPLYGAQAPGHFLLRAEMPNQMTPIFVDVTRPVPDRWRELDENFFRDAYRFDSKAQASAGYLAPLSDKQVLAVYLASRSGYFAKLGQHEAALKDAQRAQAMHPTNPTAALNAGFALESLSRYQEAEAQYRRALTLNPQSVRTMSNLAYLKVRSPESEVFNPREAERIIKQALKLEPRRAYLHATLAEIKAARQDWRAAARVMQEAISLDKKNKAYRERFMAFRARLRDDEQ